MAPRRTLLVVNPASRGGRTRSLVDPTSDILRSHGWDVEVVVTESAEHATQVAASVDADTLVAALGGDGLFARVAAGVLTSGALMAPLPAGRGADFVRALGAPRDLREVASRLPLASERRVDVGMAGDVPFLGVATLGYDSLANTYANDAPSFVPGALVYAYGGARALVHMDPHRINLRIDGETFDFTGWNVAIGNSGRYGAGMRVNPEASMDDGLLDVTVVADMPRHRYPAMLPKLYSGTHVDGRSVRAYRGAVVEVLEPTGADLYLDGDLAAPAEGVRTFTVKPDALRVLAPVSPAPSA